MRRSKAYGPRTRVDLLVTVASGYWTVSAYDNKALGLPLGTQMLKVFSFKGWFYVHYQPLVVWAFNSDWYSQWKTSNSSKMTWAENEVEPLTKQKIHAVAAFYVATFFTNMSVKHYQYRFTINRLEGTKVCRYSWHSAGSLGRPFPMLKYNIFEAILETALGNCYGLKLPKCWLRFKK